LAGTPLNLAYSLQRSTRPLAGFNGPTSKRAEGKTKRGMEEEWKRNGRGKGEVRERSKEWDGVGKERKR